MAELRRCQAVKPGGGRCQRIVPSSQDYCYSHDPHRAEERRQNASKAGKSKAAGGELAEVKDQLKDIAEKVLRGEITTAKGSVASQLLGVYLRAVEIERKQRSDQELEERIAHLELLARRVNGYR